MANQEPAPLPRTVRLVCTNCGGSGFLEDEVCPQCDGDGDFSTPVTADMFPVRREVERLRAENEQLRRRIAELEEALRHAASYLPISAWAEVATLLNSHGWSGDEILRMLEEQEHPT